RAQLLVLVGELVTDHGWSPSRVSASPPAPPRKTSGRKPPLPGRCSCDATWRAPPRARGHCCGACRVTLRWTHGPDHLPPEVPEDAMATLTCPGCAATVSHDDLICLSCGTNLPRRGPVEEETTPPTVMQEYLRPGGAAP